MAELDFLGANLRRAYPFVAEAVDGSYKRVICDAVFCLGPEFVYDLRDETTELRLVTVARDGVDWVLVFQHFQAGVQVAGSPQLAFRIGAGSPVFSKHYTKSASQQSWGMIAVGDVSGFRNEVVGAALEARVVIATNEPLPAAIGVANHRRRQAYAPRFRAIDPVNAAANFLAAKAATPVHVTNVVDNDPIDVPVVGSARLIAGKNAIITYNRQARTITIRQRVGGGQGRDCVRRLPANQSRQGSLRVVAGDGGVGYGYDISPGSGFYVNVDPSERKVVLGFRKTPASGCVDAQSRLDTATDIKPVPG